MRNMKDWERKEIGSLLIEAPGGITLKKNTDHFIKRRQVVKRLCASCSAIALWTLQTNAPSGGQGHRTGLRGGGPLTTVIKAAKLWATAWSGVLEEKAHLLRGGNWRKRELKCIFPWLDKTRTSERGQAITPEDVHPSHQYWAMPRRVRISFRSEDGYCDLCFSKSVLFCDEYFTKNYGFNYDGAWQHPLSPYVTTKKEEVPVPFHLHKEVGYHHWLGVVQARSNNRSVFQPARVVERYMDDGDGEFRVWVFGYDMDNMKARCWREGEMPVIVADKVVKPRYERHAAALVLAAEEVANQLEYRVRSALFGEKAKVRGDLSYVVDRFWQQTENAFYENLDRIRQALRNNGDVFLVLESWRALLAKSAEAVFDEVCQNGAFEAVDPGRVARAWGQLRRAVNGKKVRQDILGLPDEAMVKA